MADFDVSAGGSIPLATAKQWVANYRTKIKPGETEAHYFGAEVFERLRNVDKSVGIRIYYAIDDKGQKQLILVAVDAQGDNLLPPESEANNADPYPPIIDQSIPCPPVCARNPL